MTTKKSRPLSTPAQIVAALDRHIVGQSAAKRAVAIALRNRERRRRVAEPLRSEIQPNNILMIGPTGVGKTEIARRLAGLVDAPFLKVEATKYTEVGYVGRDVESIIRDLVETAVSMVHREHLNKERSAIGTFAQARLREVLAQAGVEDLPDDLAEFRAAVKKMEDLRIRVPLSAGGAHSELGRGARPWESGENAVRDLLDEMAPARLHEVEMPASEAWDALLESEASARLDRAGVAREARRRVEDSAIVFLDEVDKICGDQFQEGPDVSREGVQRDLLPIVEGCTVATRHGSVRTDHILFIAAGAFHSSRPSDLIPEMQGRLPIRVDLDPLTAEDLSRILVEPAHSLLRQYQALLAVEGVRLSIEREAIAEIGRAAADANIRAENIGARRLHGLMSILLEDALFGAGEGEPRAVRISMASVRRRLNGLVQDEDLSRYIL